MAGTVIMSVCVSGQQVCLYPVPRKPAAKYVDTASGDRFDLEDSGLVPRYTNKKVLVFCSTFFQATPPSIQDYGQVPGYLEQRREEMQAAQAEYDRYIEESMRRGQMEQVSNEER